MRAHAVYDRIGVGYGSLRQPDPRIAAHIQHGLGDATSIVNVGAGSGSYEKFECSVIAVEPSAAMAAQRPAGSAPVVRAIAEDLPFRDRSFDAALAILTLHHWSDWRRGLGEMARVSRRRVVVLTWQPDIGDHFWL